MVIKRDIDLHLTFDENHVLSTKKVSNFFPGMTKKGIEKENFALSIFKFRKNNAVNVLLNLITDHTTQIQAWCQLYASSGRHKKNVELVSEEFPSSHLGAWVHVHLIACWWCWRTPRFLLITFKGPWRRISTCSTALLIKVKSRFTIHTQYFVTNL